MFILAFLAALLGALGLSWKPIAFLLAVCVLCVVVIFLIFKPVKNRKDRYDL